MSPVIVISSTFELL